MYEKIENEHSEDVDDEPQTCKDVCKSFAEKTSMQGIPYINTSKSWRGEIAWTIIFIVGSVFMLFHLYYLFSTYFAWPKKTTVNLGFDALDFPAISICNTNPVRKSKLDLATEELRKLINGVNPTYVSKMYGQGDNKIEPNGGAGKKTDTGLGLFDDLLLSRKKRFLGILKLNKSDALVDVKMEDFFKDDAWENVGVKDESSEVYENFIELFNFMNRTDRIAMGHKISDMLVKCSFAGRSCYADNFTLKTNPYYGNCFTLQSPFFKSRRSGPSQGLELILYMENHEFIRGITNGNGAQLLIHESGTEPHLHDEGIALPAAAESYIGMKTIKIARLGKPFGECNETETFSEKFGIKYTRSSCQEVCEAEAVMERCNCSSYFLEEINMKISNIRSIPKKCETSDDLKCVKTVARLVENGTLHNHCMDPCNEVSYEKSVSHRQWPSDDYATMLLSVVCSQKGRTSGCNALIDYYNTLSLSLNFVKVNIYFDSLNYQTITEEQDYEDSQFASDVGGTVGLWIGLSIISVFEVIQFIGELLGYLLFTKRNQSPKA